MVLVGISSSPQNLFPNKKISFTAAFFAFIGLSLPHEPHKQSILGNKCTLQPTSDLVQELHCASCNSQPRSAGAWCSFPTYILLILATLSSSLWWRMILAYCSCMEGPMAFVQRWSHKTSPERVRLATVRGGSGERQFPELHGSEVLCSPNCNAFCQPLQILCFCEYSNALQYVSMQGVGLDRVRRKTAFPVVREHSGISKHICNWLFFIPKDRVNISEKTSVATIKTILYAKQAVHLNACLSL